MGLPACLPPHLRAGLPRPRPRPPPGAVRPAPGRSDAATPRGPRGPRPAGADGGGGRSPAQVPAAEHVEVAGRRDERALGAGAGEGRPVPARGGQGGDRRGHQRNPGEDGPGPGGGEAAVPHEVQDQRLRPAARGVPAADLPGSGTGAHPPARPAFVDDDGGSYPASCVRFACGLPLTTLPSETALLTQRRSGSRGFEARQSRSASRPETDLCRAHSFPDVRFPSSLDRHAFVA